MIRKFFRWNHLPTLLLGSMIIYLSSQPGGTVTWLVPPLDKMAHLGVFGALALSLCSWIRPSRWMQSPWLYSFLVVSLVSLFGLTDEFHQSFVPGREVSLLDWAADLSGAVLAVAFVRGMYFWNSRRVRAESSLSRDIS